MALKPLDIFKYLPKTNCKECGFPTCLAFAMQVAMGKEDISKCTRISEESKKALASSAAPPIRTITVGRGSSKVNIGGETVLFRHEKTFYNPSAIGILIKESLPEEEIHRKIEMIGNIQYERVGLVLKPDIIAVEDEGKGKFSDIVNLAYNTGKSLMLMSKNIQTLKNVLPAVRDAKPILFSANEENFKEMVLLAKEFSSCLVVRAENLEKMACITAEIEKIGFQDIVLYPEVKNVSELLEHLVLIRNSAITGRIRELGYPVIAMPYMFTDDIIYESILGAMSIAKYASVVILSDIKGEMLFPLLLERLNIFTDPQRPLVTPEGLYEIGKPDGKSPLLITSNFSLTYFIVSGELENSKVSAFLGVQDTEGLSVLTAWAADKMNAETISALVKKLKVEEKISHRTLIIPGVLAQIVGELEDELPGWKIVLGPREASKIPAFLRGWDREAGSFKSE